jgi:hypothetical protein
MNRHLRTIVNFSESAVFIVEGRGNDVHVVTMSSQTTGKSLCESGSTIYVWWESVGANDYRQGLRFYGH